MAKLTVAKENDLPVELHVEDVGRGKPVVLIHGWPLSGRSWEAQVPALVDAGCRVITYDRRGFGWSSQPWGGYDYDTLAADLDAILTQRDVRGATLVGFSMGGGEVARYVGRYGTSRVARAVFAASVTPWLHKDDDNPEGAMDEATIAAFQGAVRSDRLAFLDGFTRNFFAVGDKPGPVSEAQRRYATNIAEFASPRGTYECISAFARTDFRADLKKLNVPTLVIHGDSDAIVPFPASGKRTHAAVPFSELVLVKNAPHGLNLTHAKEFNEALLRFVRS